MTQMDEYLTLTAKGVFYAFLNKEPSDKQRALQVLLSDKKSQKTSEWLIHYSHSWLDEFVQMGYVESLAEALYAPLMPLDKFLPYVVASLSATRRAAIASAEGFCLAKIGYSQEDADRLSVAAADFFDFFIRQEQRGLELSGRAISLFSEVDLLLAEVSFVFLWIDDMGYVLILDDEPLTNNRAFVELIWAIKTSGLRYMQ